MSPMFILSEGFAVCQALMIVLGSADLHQGFGELEWDGTFINGVRLGPEGLESKKYELKSDDTVVSRLIPSALSHRSC